MYRTYFLVPVVCCFLATLIATSAARAQSDESTEASVAILDVAEVFEKDEIFNATMAKLNDTANQLRQQAREAARSDDDSENVEAGIKTRMLTAELMKREANAYAGCYSRMQKVVASLAKEHGIKLVLRADTSSVEEDDRAEVVKRINSSIVYHYRLDLTSMVVNKMKQVSETSSPENASIFESNELQPKYCDQCGHKLSTEIADCECDVQSADPDAHPTTGN